MFNNKTIFFLW